MGIIGCVCLGLGAPSALGDLAGVSGFALEAALAVVHKDALGPLLLMYRAPFEDVLGVVDGFVLGEGYFVVFLRQGVEGAFEAVLVGHVIMGELPCPFMEEAAAEQFTLLVAQ